MVWPLVLLGMMTFVVVFALLRQLNGVVAEPVPAQRGVWQVLADGHFSSPVGLAADHVGTLYVVDSANYHVYKVSPEGRLITAVGSRGTAPGQFDRPSAARLDSTHRPPRFACERPIHNTVRALPASLTPYCGWRLAGGLLG